ncbi:hypothetical protein ABZ721_16350 [Streptomyces sp. NPDC006733]|uniref:hypothetical protein n=1 Tax=Streptomyces sp. NPDC006733 TaxID=3155460 RepID=UPI0033CCFC69
MSHWDADRQQWVRGPEPDRQRPGPYEPPPSYPSGEPYEPPVYPSGASGAPYEPPVYPPPPDHLPSSSEVTHDATRYEPPVLGPSYGPPPGPPGPPPGPPRGWSRATVLTAVVVSVVLAAGLGFGGWALLRHQGKGDGTGPASSSSSWEQPSTDSSSDSPSGSPTDTSPSTESSSPSDSPSADGSTAPAGFVRTSDPAGFSLLVPEDWRERSTEGDSVFYKTSDGTSLIQVFALRGPETTPFESLQATEDTVAKNNGYQQIRLERLGSGAGDPAELEYSYVRTDGTVRHVVVQAFTDPSAVQYALLVAGPDSDWSAHEEVFRNVLSSFCTTGHCPPGSG